MRGVPPLDEKWQDRLIVLRFRDGDKNSLRDVVVQWGDILPAQDHLQVNLLEGLGNQVGRPQHRQEVQEGQGLVNKQGLVECCGKMFWNGGEKEILQDGRGYREGFLRPVHSQPSDSLQDEVERTIL